MQSLLIFIISYICLITIYTIYMVMSYKKDRVLESIQAQLLIKKFKFNKKDLNKKKMAIIITMIDPLIISLTGTIVSLPRINYVLEIIIGFIVLMGMIYSFYEIIGRILRKEIENGKHKKNRK